MAIHLLELTEKSLAGCNVAEAALDCGILEVVLVEKLVVVDCKDDADALEKNLVFRARRRDNLTGVDIVMFAVLNTQSVRGCDERKAMLRASSITEMQADTMALLHWNVYC